MGDLVKHIIQCTFFAFFITVQIDAVRINISNRSGFHINYDYAEGSVSGGGPIFPDDGSLLGPLRTVLPIQQHMQGFFLLEEYPRGVPFEAFLEQGMLYVYMRDTCVFSQSVNSKTRFVELMITKQMLMPHSAGD